jgi:dynein heavy chain, axonemal
VLSTVQAAPRILYMRAFAQLFQGRPSGLHIRNVINTTPRFVRLLADISSTLSEDYATGRECAKLLEPVRMIHDHQMAWDKHAYADAVGSDSRRVRLDLRKFRSWKTELDKMKVSQVRAGAASAAKAPQMRNSLRARRSRVAC